MEIPKFIDLGDKKYIYENLKNNRWAKGSYVELAEQLQILLQIEDKKSNDYLMQVGVVRYLIKNLDRYLTLVKVS